MLAGLPGFHRAAVTAPAALSPFATVVNPIPAPIEAYQPESTLPETFVQDLAVPPVTSTIPQTRPASMPIAVPEPSSFAMLMTGLFALVLIISLGRPRFLRTVPDDAHTNPPDRQIDLFAGALIAIEVGWVIFLFRLAERFL